MYSYEDRIKAVMLYIKYDLCTADTIRELGYPNGYGQSTKHHSTTR